MRRAGVLAFAGVLALAVVGVGQVEAPDPSRATITSRVLRVIDGDTVDIRGSQRVRLLGIDTPELGEPYSEEAIAFTKRLLLFKTVRLELDVKERDVYDRLLAYAYVETDEGWVMANLEIVRAGLARLLIIPPNGKYRAQFEAAQLEAMIHHRGLWGTVGEVLTVSELEARISEVVNQVVTVRLTVAAVLAAGSGRRVDPSETRFGFHLFLVATCPPVGLGPGTEILATGVVEYASLKDGPRILIEDPTQIVLATDVEAVPP
ncbi:MAG: thermonuclease family protein [Candidatus Bipolaricaulis anaerobius]|nr:thermonuclease family protein [Candidatus Bipolaricaulis anaerobius]